MRDPYIVGRGSQITTSAKLLDIKYEYQFNTDLIEAIN